MATYSITLPDDLLTDLSLNEAALTRLAQEALLVRLYALGKVDAGKLAHLLGLSRYEALDLIERYGVTRFDDAAVTNGESPYHPVKAAGIWAGVTISDADIAEVRRAMFHSLGEQPL